MPVFELNVKLVLREDLVLTVTSGGDRVFLYLIWMVLQVGHAHHSPPLDDDEHSSFKAGLVKLILSNEDGLFQPYPELTVYAYAQWDSIEDLLMRPQNIINSFMRCLRAMVLFTTVRPEELFEHDVYDAFNGLMVIEKINHLPVLYLMMAYLPIHDVFQHTADLIKHAVALQPNPRMPFGYVGMHSLYQYKAHAMNELDSDIHMLTPFGLCTFFLRFHVEQGFRLTLIRLDDPFDTTGGFPEVSGILEVPPDILNKMVGESFDEAMATVATVIENYAVPFLKHKFWVEMVVARMKGVLDQNIGPNW